MVFLNPNCDFCNNYFRDSNNEYHYSRCKAFPDGIPATHMFGQDVTKLKECANGYKYEEDEEARRLYDWSIK